MDERNGRPLGPYRARSQLDAPRRTRGRAAPRLARIPRLVKSCEMGPRDGLQNEAAAVPTADKIRYIDLLSASGLAVIETTSFVRPNAIPQLTDAEAVMAGIARKPGVTYVCLVP